MSSYSSENEEKRPKLIWNKNVERLLSTWADIASGHRWLHEKSYRKYNEFNFWFSFPIICLTTITGTLSVAGGNLFPEDLQKTAQIAIGAVNIGTSVLTTLQNLFKHAQLSESHLNAYVGWSRLYRNIVIELSLERKNRRDPNDFVKICRNEYDRLMEQQPLLPPDIIRAFKINFAHVKDLVLPDAVDKLEHTKVTIGEDEKSLSHKDLKQTVPSSMNALKQALIRKFTDDTSKKENIPEPQIQIIEEHKDVPYTPVFRGYYNGSSDDSEVEAQKKQFFKKKTTHRVVSNFKPPVKENVARDIKVNVKDLIKKMEGNNVPIKKDVPQEIALLEIQPDILSKLNNNIQQKSDNVKKTEIPSILDLRKDF